LGEGSVGGREPGVAGSSARFVPNLYRAMASNPDYLEANWRRVKPILATDGKLDRLTKEIIAVAVSAVNACRY
jgi:alkylhydroperoxidase family enzyme